MPDGSRPVAEQPKAQRRIQAVASVLDMRPLLIVPTIDHRFHWSRTLSGGLAADAALAVAFLLAFLVFRENSHAAGIVRSGPTSG